MADIGGQIGRLTTRVLVVVVVCGLCIELLMYFGLKCLTMYLVQLKCMYWNP